jgi:hypothetical protein
MKHVEQTYTLTNIQNLSGLYPAGYTISINHPDAKAYVVQAQQLYSGSGKSMLFNDQFNTCYASADYTPEITDITVIDDASLVNLDCSGTYSLSTCFKLPSLTYGYLEIPFDVSYTPSEERKPSINEHSLQVIPNPALESVQMVVGNSIQATLFIYNS